MLNVLLTAFEPYDRWGTNASWMAMVEYTKQLPQGIRLTTRRYPVDFVAVRRCLEKDLSADHDYAIHLGQAPGSTCLRLESIGINVCGRTDQCVDQYGPLIEDGPVAYRSALPLADWARELRSRGIPAQVSYHAGEYLCNATLYLSHYLIERSGWKTRAAFIHVPLDITQTLSDRPDLPSLPTARVAEGLRLIIDGLRSAHSRVEIA